MVQPTTGLSNNSFSPKAPFCNLMRTVMINDSILWPGLRLYVWHWSLQFWKDENNQIPLFLWSSSHFWCSFGFGTVSDFRIKTYLVHSDSCFQITRTRNSSKVSPLGSFTQCFQWLYWNPSSALMRCPKTPNPAGQIHMCADLADLHVWFLIATFSLDLHFDDLALEFLFYLDLEICVFKFYFVSSFKSTQSGPRPCSHQETGMNSFCKFLRYLNLSDIRHICIGSDSRAAQLCSPALLRRSSRFHVLNAGTLQLMCATHTHTENIHTQRHLHARLHNFYQIKIIIQQPSQTNMTAAPPLAILQAGQCDHRLIAGRQRVARQQQQKPEADMFANDSAHGSDQVTVCYLYATNPAQSKITAFRSLVLFLWFSLY